MIVVPAIQGGCRDSSTCEADGGDGVGSCYLAAADRYADHPLVVTPARPGLRLL